MYFLVFIQTHAYIIRDLFCIFKTHIIDLIQLVLIKIRFNVLMWSLLSTYFLVLLQEYFINCTVNDIIILLLSVKFPPVYDIVPVELSSPIFIILKTNVYKDLAFIWWMTGAMDEMCGFLTYFRLVYISFHALDSSW